MMNDHEKKILAQYEELANNKPAVLAHLPMTDGGWVEVPVSEADKFMGKTLEFAFAKHGGRERPRGRGYQPLTGFTKFVITPTGSGQPFTKEGVERVRLYGKTEMVVVSFEEGEL